MDAILKMIPMLVTALLASLVTYQGDAQAFVAAHQWLNVLLWVVNAGAMWVLQSPRKS